MNKVFIILAFPHIGWGDCYVWKVFNSFDKAKEELNKLAEKHEMVSYNDKEIVGTLSPSRQHRFIAFEIFDSFVN